MLQVLLMGTGQFLPGRFPPRTITLHANYPPDNHPLDSYPLWQLPPDNYPLDNYPSDNSPLCQIPPGQFPLPFNCRSP